MINKQYNKNMYINTLLAWDWAQSAQAVVSLTFIADVYQTSRTSANRPRRVRGTDFGPITGSARFGCTLWRRSASLTHSQLLLLSLCRGHVVFYTAEKRLFSCRNTRPSENWFFKITRFALVRYNNDNVYNTGRGVRESKLEREETNARSTPSRFTVPHRVTATRPQRIVAAAADAADP